MIARQRAYSFLKLGVHKTDLNLHIFGLCHSTLRRWSTSIARCFRPALLRRELHVPRMLHRTVSSIPQLTVQPDDHLLVDDELQLKITGLDRHQKTTVHAVISEGSSVFESCCCFTADDNGEINMATQPSVAGSYTGISPMGMFWSMVQAPGQKTGLRLSKKDMTTPMTTNMAVYNDHLSVDTVRSATPDPICIGSVDRWYMGPGVKREVVRHGRIRGVLYQPPGKGPFPAVIDMFGTAGGIMEFRAALLASHGFACLSLPYFKYEDLPDNLFNLDLDYFMEAMDWLSTLKDVCQDGVGIVGVSKGADIALIMATHSPKVKCVVNINGMTFCASAGLKYGNSYIPPVAMEPERMYEEHGAFVCQDCWPYTEKDLTPVWQSDAKILNIVGEDDKCSPWQNIQFMKDHFPRDKTHNFEVVSYPKAGHLIEPPYTPLCRMSYHKSFEMKFWWGGYPEEHNIAQEDSWKRILEHLNKYIPKTSKSNPSLASHL